MRLYLDTSAVIAFLYEEVAEPWRYSEMEQLVNTINRQQMRGLISFYAFTEMYQYLAGRYPPDDVSEGFREGLLRLLNIPLIIVPYLDRIDMNRFIRRFSIPDSYDALHVACALFHRCDAIVTYDSHFQTVTNVIDVLTPLQALGRLSTP